MKDELIMQARKNGEITHRELARRVGTNATQVHRVEKDFGEMKLREIERYYLTLASNIRMNSGDFDLNLFKNGFISNLEHYIDPVVGGLYMRYTERLKKEAVDEYRKNIIPVIWFIFIVSLIIGMGISLPLFIFFI